MSPRERLSGAHAQYYTPTASGLKSFHCDAEMDWKAMLTRWSGKEIRDDNPFLKYLQSVHLSVSDEFRGQGTLEWTGTTAPPTGKEEAVEQVQHGLQTAVSGFFQSWNAYMNGSMVPLPDSTLTVTQSGEGVHLSGAAKDMQIDEDFDKNMLLTQTLVVSPTVRVLATPTYVPTTDGLVVTSVKSLVNQPPTAPQTEATFRIDYAKVDSFQIPSRIVLDVKNTGVIEIGLSGCQITTADWSRRP
ncbi:MAG: hypothetical protein WAM85_20540 [Terracidiphilus sp.]